MIDLAANGLNETPPAFLEEIKTLIEEARSYVGIGWDHSNESARLTTSCDKVESLLGTVTRVDVK